VRSKSSRRETSAPSSVLVHRVDAYAEAVISGGIVAGPLVRLACERHVNDRSGAGVYRFDEARADHAIDFFETVLKLPDMLDDDGRPMPFLLQPWQAFIVGSLFGWVDRQGRRRFREAYIEIGKGNGKTPLCAGIGLYGLVMDGERAAEIYAAAADQDQAQILFRDAVRIVEASPDLWPIISQSGGEHVWKLDHKPSLSFFKTFSRESGAKSGTRPHMGLLDELHEHGTPQISIKVRAGAKRREQPLFVEITNSGFDRTSICWQHHEHSRKVVEGSLTDEQWFAYVCALDQGDNPLKDESCWSKVNPNLGVSIGYEYLRRQVANAINIQAEANTVLRLNFCVWTQADSRAIDMPKWRGCLPMPTEQELIGAPCFGCLDLGETDDFTAWGRLWVLTDGRVAVKMRYWVPRVALERYPNRPYQEWERMGSLGVTDGDVTDYAVVRAQILADYRALGMQAIYFDPKTARETAQILEADGVSMVQMPQGFALNEGITRTLALIVSGHLCHGNEPILTWMASNLVVLTGIKGERRIAKERAADKIDGMAALVMGVQGAVVMRERVEKKYQMLFVGGKRRWWSN
jgi:phage terminase large subunit-like protein